MDWSAIIGYLVGTGGLLYSVFKFWLDRGKQAFEQQLADEVQATKTLEAEIARQDKRIDKLETDHHECMSGRIEQARQAGVLEGRVNEQSATIQQLTALNANQAATIAELKTKLENYTNKAA